MDDAQAAQLVEGAIDLQGCAKAFRAEFIEDLVGAERRSGA
jgi:hypothetical protein